MIKINLLPQRRVKRVADPGQRDVGIGVLALLLAGVATFMLVQRPEQKKLDDLKATVARLNDPLATLAGVTLDRAA